MATVRVPRGPSGVFAWSFALRGFAAATGFLVTVALGRLLGPTGFGAYTFAMGWVSIAMLATTLGFQHYSVRALPRMEARGHRREMTGLTLFALSLTAVSSLIAVLLIWRLPRLPGLTLDPAMAAALTSAAILLTPLTLNQVRQGILRGLDRPLWGQAPELAMQPACLLALLSFIYLTNRPLDAEGAIELTLLAALTAGAAGLVTLLRAVRSRLCWPPVFRPAVWSDGAAKSFALGAAGLLMSSADVVMLGMLSTAEATGIYGVAAKFYYLSMVPTLAVTSTLSHQVSRLFASGDKDALQQTVRRTAKHGLVLTLLVAIGSTLAVPFFGDIFGVGFVPAGMLVIILVWSRVGETMLGQPAVPLTNTAYTGTGAGVVSAAAAFNVLLNLLLIPALGALGAATSTALSHFLMTAVLAWMTYRKLRIITPLGPLGDALCARKVK